MVIALAEAGASICIAQKNLFNTETADAIKSGGGNAQIVEYDLSIMADAKAVFQKAFDVMDDRVDILVNYSGLLKRKETISIIEEE